jgi:hypothetical protein
MLSEATLKLCLLHACSRKFMLFLLGEVALSYQQRRKQTQLPGPKLVVRKGIKYDRVLLNGKTIAIRNNLTGIASGVTAYFKYLPKS